MARYRVGNSYLSEEEYKEHEEGSMVFWFSVIVFLFLSYQMNSYLKENYMTLFSSVETRVFVSIIPGFIAFILMQIFRTLVASLLSFLISGVVLYIAWKILFYFLS